MNLCDRCSRNLDKQRDATTPTPTPFKSTTDEIVYIQSQVRRVEHEIEQLTSQRVTLQRRLNAIAASTVTFPYEIISTIFEHACPPLDVGNTSEAGVVDTNTTTATTSVVSAKDGAGVTFPNMPFKLAAVCSQWRDIVLSMPQLWTSIAFTLYQSQSVSNAFALDTIFRRSGNCRVTISLIFASGDEGRDRLENDVPPSVDVLDVFMQHSQRWGTLKIDGLPPEWIPVLRQAKNKTPNVERVWLCPYDNSREQQMVDMFVEAPMLRRVTLDNTFLSAIVLPWSGLTHLKVSWVSIDECAEMLRRCEALVECDFQRILSNAEFHPLPQGDVPPVVLQHLKTLRWSYAGDAWEFQLFERMHFPVLKHLKLKLRYDLAHFRVIQVVLGKVLGETSMGVERLDLDLGCPWAHVYEILRGVPRVREVRLVDEHDPEFVRMLMGALVPLPSPSYGPSPAFGQGSNGYGVDGTRMDGSSSWGVEGTGDRRREKETVFLPQLRSLEFQGNNPTDYGFPRMVVEQLKKRWDVDTRDVGPVVAFEVGELPGIDRNASVGGATRSRKKRATSSSSSPTPSASSMRALSSPARSRLENVNLELSSEIYVDGLAGQAGVVREGLRELMKVGMKVRIVNGFEGKGWL
ncbi:hypothetical protein D9756_004529 [Leucocoprinus leucothites]|uniref:F-box domain-containing protein n=1 Tax=Leucocoprinus leucothites TaxID=201217 RepID=A0A8H5LKG2_9AGAR|nr:hypothetical protein D9756_004529 [Leucoagaricus leucothites]